jgi:oligosaccharide reducing-end xylanase
LITGQTLAGVKTAGPIFDLERRMVRFTPDIANTNYTDPSYHLPAFYELWAMWGPVADRSFWQEAAAASREFFLHAAHPVTGLTPDYAMYDGKPYAPYFNTNAVDFRFDAWRTAMNWSVDWAWWAKDARVRGLSDRLQAFCASQGMTNYANQYTLDGKPLSTDHSAGMIGVNAVASLAATQPRAKDFVEALWDLPVPSGEWRYYDGMLYMMSMLHCSGEFRVWTPRPGS